MTNCVGTVSGRYNHWKLAITAAFKDSIGLTFEKKIDAPGCERSSTRKLNFGIGHDGGVGFGLFGGGRGCCGLWGGTGLLGGGGGGGGGIIEMLS